MARNCRLALARWLADHGHSAQHVTDCNLEAATDGAIWSFALERSAVIITKDEDFAIRRTLSASGPQVVWIRLRNVRKRELLIWMESAFPHILAALDRNEALIEVV